MTTNNICMQFILIIHSENVVYTENQIYRIIDTVG